MTTLSDIRFAVEPMGFQVVSDRNNEFRVFVKGQPPFSGATVETVDEAVAAALSMLGEQQPQPIQQAPIERKRPTVAEAPIGTLITYRTAGDQYQMRLIYDTINGFKIEWRARGQILKTEPVDGPHARAEATFIRRVLRENSTSQLRYTRANQ